MFCFLLVNGAITSISNQLELGFFRQTLRSINGSEAFDVLTFELVLTVR